MPPHPKRKHSKSRRDMRRAHDALQPRNLVACSNCGSMRLPHTVCPNCGFYEGREVVEVKKEKKKSEWTNQRVVTNTTRLCFKGRWLHRRSLQYTRPHCVGCSADVETTNIYLIVSIRPRKTRGLLNQLEQISISIHKPQPLSFPDRVRKLSVWAKNWPKLILLQKKPSRMQMPF